jgi:hypothetical protein
MEDRQVADLQQELRELYKLVERLRINGECFCEMAIDNPMMRDHSAVCTAIRAHMEKWA